MVFFISSILYKKILRRDNFDQINADDKTDVSLNVIKLLEFYWKIHLVLIL